MSCRLAWATRDRQTDEECGSERKGCSVKHCGLSVKTRLLCEGDGGVWVYLLENPRYPDSLGLWRGILLPENVSYLSLPFSSLLNDYTISVTFDKTILALQTCPHLPLLATPPQAHISVREEGFFLCQRCWEIWIIIHPLAGLEEMGNMISLWRKSSKVSTQNRP